MNSKLSNGERMNAETLAEYLLQELGHDLSREGMKDTPKRFVKFISEFAPRKAEDLQKTIKFTKFKKDGRGMLVQGGIPVASLCEHHICPFVGEALIGYLPFDHQIGLSKLSRVVEYFAHQLQNQERITCQVADYLAEHLSPHLGVIIMAEHSCMTVRGVRIHGTAKTITSELRGSFETVAMIREEFWAHYARLTTGR